MNAPVRIFLAEKNDVTRRLLAGILANKGYAVEESSGGADALGVAGNDYALALVDVDSDPAASARLVAALTLNARKTPVVLMAEGLDSDGAVQAMRHGSFPLLTRPVTPEKMLAEVARHIKAQPRAQKPVIHRWQDIDRDESGRDQRRVFMRRAIDLSQQKMEENAGGPFGAVIVRQGKIVGEGWNGVTSLKDPTAHAEIMAIRNACQTIGHYSLEGCEVYTSCEPCPMCLAALYWARVDRIFYANTRDDAAAAGFDDEYIYREVALPFEKRTMPCFMMLRDEAQIVFGAWNDKKDKTPY